MLETFISKAVDDTFKKQFDLDIKQSQKAKGGDKFYVSSIDIVFKDRDKTILLYASRPMLARVADILLFETDPDEDCLIDLSKEIANLVVGHAKVLASDQGYGFKIKTPVFDGKTSAYDGTLYYECEGSDFIIGLNDGR
jgi:hypothetical protein